MLLRLSGAILIVLSLLLAPLNLTADESDTPDLTRLHAAVEELVTKHYPKADVTLHDGKFRFQYNTRKFMIHEPTLLGEWQDAFEEIGPNKGGHRRHTAIPARPLRWDGGASIHLRQALLHPPHDSSLL